MLHSLRVENIAIIDSLEIEFGPGLNLLTGETGAGKSIIVDALGLILGAKAPPEVIRAGADVGSVEAEVAVNSRNTRLVGVLERHEIESEDRRIVLRREVGEKRSRAFIQGRSVALSVLKDVASQLVSIYGQHEHQALFDAVTHLRLLTLFGGHEELAAATAAHAREALEAQETIRRIEAKRAEAGRRRDYLQFQVREIKEAAVGAGEEDALRMERQRLLNAEKIRALATAAVDGLYAAEGSALERISAARRSLDELTRIDSALEPLRAPFDEMAEAIRETSRKLGDVAAGADADPTRLEVIEDRLYLIERLKKKYGPETADVLRALADAETELAALERLEVHSGEAQERFAAAAAAYRRSAGLLGQRRRESADRLSKALRRQLSDLAMPSVRFEVRFAPAVAEFDENGLESAEFYISPNPGEPVRPLSLIASGGELSRVMLALRNSASDEDPERTLVFDEIDVGIGGPTADVVGRKLASVARRQQVLCVTHLPQVAAFADHHLSVAKSTSAGRTVARVTPLDREGRVQEIARMLGSAEPSAVALRHAQEILRKAQASQP